MTSLDLRRLRRGTLANTLAWLAVLVLLAGGLYYQDKRDQQRQRQICGIITIMDDQYQRNPPTTSTGQGMAAAVHRYRAQVGC
jgi:hypothetical protein